MNLIKDYSDGLILSDSNNSILYQPENIEALTTQVDWFPQLKKIDCNLGIPDIFLTEAGIDRLYNEHKILDKESFKLSCKKINVYTPLAATDDWVIIIDWYCCCFNSEYNKQEEE